MKKFTIKQAEDLGRQLGIDFNKSGFTTEEFLEGLHIELEHGTVDPSTNVTDDDELVTAKIALAHLNENHLYYNENVGLEAWEHALDDVKDNMKGDMKGKKIKISIS